MTKVVERYNLSFRTIGLAVDRLKLKDTLEQVDAVTQGWSSKDRDKEESWTGRERHDLETF